MMGDPSVVAKLALAVRLRAETAMTVKWIAERLRMGPQGRASHLLYRHRKAKGKKHANIKN
jgi:hypothetical protein